jgi:benzodiazapine receptor
MNFWHEALGLGLWLLGSFASGWFGSHFIPGAWYESLNKPAWTPPNAVFPLVWFVLYALMGIAAWLVWLQSRFSHLPFALAFFVFMLLLNILWSYLFFGLHQTGAAFIEILVLWIVILAVVISFWRIRPVAGLMMLPCLLWVGFASVLNYWLWRMNT